MSVSNAARSFPVSVSVSVSVSEKRLLITLALLAANGIAPAAAQQSRDGPTLALDAAMSGIYDSNIHRDRTELGLYGGGLELLARYANRTKRPTLQLEYAAVRRASSPVAIESLVGQRASGLVAAPLAGGVRLELIGRGSSGGVDEDMNPGRELSLMSRLELEPGRAHRLRLYGTRLWRDDAPPALPTPGYHAGAEYRIRIGDRATVQTGYRYELLEPLDSTREWHRSAASLELATRLTRRGTLELGGRYRLRDYPRRFVSVGDEQQLRHDEDWRAGVAWVYRNDSGTELRLGYEQEARTSNDVRRPYEARRALLSIRQTVFRLRGGGAPRIDDELADIAGSRRAANAPLRFSTLAALDAQVCGVTADGAAHCWATGAEPPAAKAQPVPPPEGQAWTQLTAGPRIVCGLTTLGAVYCWKPADPAAVPAPVRGGRVFTSIAIGHDHVCALGTDKRAFCWGSNRDGALGDGSLKDSWEPVMVSGDVTFRSLAAGARHTCGVATYDIVYCWGSNTHGQLGLRHVQRITEPVPIDTLRFTTVTAGPSHSCALTAGGQAWCWGENGRGQLGTGSTGPAALPQIVRTEARFTAITAGWAHTCALANEGQAYCWGQNRYGQLGVGPADERSHTTPEPVVGRRIFTALSASFRTCGLRASGAIECWGAGVSGVQATAETAAAAREKN